MARELASGRWLGCQPTGLSSDPERRVSHWWTQGIRTSGSTGDRRLPGAGHRTTWSVCPVTPGPSRPGLVALSLSLCVTRASSPWKHRLRSRLSAATSQRTGPGTVHPSRAVSGLGSTPRVGQRELPEVCAETGRSPPRKLYTSCREARSGTVSGRRGPCRRMESRTGPPGLTLGSAGRLFRLQRVEQVSGQSPLSSQSHRDAEEVL